MSGAVDASNDPATLAAAGLPADAVSAWAAAAPRLTHSYAEDRDRFSGFWLQSNGLIGLLPPAGRRSDRERIAAEKIVAAARKTRTLFLREHVESLYNALTQARTRAVRVQHLVLAAAEAVPGLVPSKADLASEDGRLQRDRSGIEIDQGLFVSAVLQNQGAGRHLCHSMLLPRPDSLDLLDRFKRDGSVTLEGASVRRRGKASTVTYEHPRFLNAEDQGTLDAAEICVDLALLDEATDIVILRGGVVEHPKYRGRRLFGAGINLTHLYHGRIPFVWYLQRDLGYVNKIYRGLALLDEATDIVILRGGVVEHPKYRGRRLFGAGINLTHLYHGRIPFVWYLQRDLGYVNKIYRGLAMLDDAPPDECGGATIEKLWIAAVEGFAIGGHCQVLLVCDYVIAEADAYLTLPARKEGIIPGAANLRLTRFTGDRIARQAILNERRIECASPEGRLICDAIIEPGGMDAAIEEQVSRLTNSGIVSAAGNRRAFRIAEEPFDLFRSYMAIYAREQAYCHFSPALIGNLERHWNAQNRKP